MDFLTGLLIAVKSLVFMGGYVNASTSNPTFTQIALTTTQSDISVSCQLSTLFPDDLAKLAQAGATITLYLTSELRIRQTDSLVASKQTRHILTYDLVTNFYRIEKSYAPLHDSIVVADSAFKYMGAFLNIPLLNRTGIEEEKSYYISMYAVLGKTSLVAMNNRTIDLMYFWRYKRPFLKTAPFPGASLKPQQ